MPVKKASILFALLFLMIQFPKAQKLAGALSAPTDSVKSNYLSFKPVTLTDSIINYGKMFLNTPYRYGSTGISSFDCSGFTSYVYNNFGYHLDRSSADQAKQFDSVDRTQLKTGDLVFFSGRRKGKRVGHVGIVVSANSDGNFNFIHASVHDGVVISNSDEDYYRKRFIKANRVVGSNQLLAVAPSNNQLQMSLAGNVVNTPGTTTRQSKRVVPAEYHRVRKGETLSTIAQNYDLSIAELKKLNHLSSSKINPKQQLKVKDEETVLVMEPVQLAANQPVVNTPAPQQQAPATTTANTPTSSVSLASIGSMVVHLVQKGETLFSISNLYHVTIDQLKKNNNIQQNTILPGQHLKIVPSVDNSAKPPVVENNAVAVAPKEAVVAKPVTHKVVSGESLYSIARDNNLTVDELKDLNHISSTSLRPGQELVVSKTADKTPATASVPAETTTAAKDNAKTDNVVSSKTSSYTVKKGESLYSISKDKNIPVDKIKDLNSLSDNSIKAGQKLILPDSDATVSTSTRSNASTSAPSVTHHKVRSGESFYSIAQKYGCSQNDLKKWNHRSGNKLKPGEKLVIYQK